MSNQEIIQEIYELQALLTECRKDAQKLAMHINRGAGGREVALAITKLQEADSWLHLGITELIPKQPTEGNASDPTL